MKASRKRTDPTVIDFTTTGVTDIIRKEVPELKDTPFWKIFDIISTANEKMADYVTMTGLKVKSPYSIFTLSVEKYKMGSNSRSIDWINTRKYGKMVYLFNNHTNGWGAKVTCSFKGSLLGTFVSSWGHTTSRHLSRLVAKVLKKDPKTIELYRATKYY